MKDLDNFSALTSFCGGLLGVLIWWVLWDALPFRVKTMCFFTIFSFFLTFFLPYIFCSCQCERKYIFHSIGGLGALTGASLGWGFYQCITNSFWWNLWNMIGISIFAFLFSRYYCMIYKEKDDSPIFKKFLIIFSGVIAYIFLMFFFANLISPNTYPSFWFLFTILFWTFFLIIPEYIGTKSIPHYLNNLGVAFIVILPLGIQSLHISLLWYMELLIFLPLFSLLYSIIKNEKTYLYDAISVLCVAIICDILVIVTLPLVTTGY